MVMNTIIIKKSRKSLLPSEKKNNKIKLWIIIEKSQFVRKYKEQIEQRKLARQKIHQNKSEKSPIVTSGRKIGKAFTSARHSPTSR